MSEPTTTAKQSAIGTLLRIAGDTDYSETTILVPAGTLVQVAQASPLRYSIRFCTDGNGDVRVSTRADATASQGLTIPQLDDRCLDVKTDGPLAQAPWYATGGGVGVNLTIFETFFNRG